MLSPGEIYYCERIKGDGTSGHWWVLLFVDANVVRYVTATSQIKPFVYREGLQGLQQPKEQPDSVVFLDTQKIVGQNNLPIFSKPTILNCFHSMRSISLQDFNTRIDRKLLRIVGRLPDRYLAQIVPSARCSGQWSRVDVKQVLHAENGIGGCVNAFYDGLR